MYAVTVGEDEKFLEVGYGDGCRKNMNVLNAAELYA